MKRTQAIPRWFGSMITAAMGFARTMVKACSGVAA
jgi:hypothetical protein